MHFLIYSIINTRYNGKYTSEFGAKKEYYVRSIHESNDRLTFKDKSAILGRVVIRYTRVKIFFSPVLSHTIDAKYTRINACVIRTYSDNRRRGRFGQWRARFSRQDSGRSVEARVGPTLYHREHTQASAHLRLLPRDTCPRQECRWEESETAIRGRNDRKHTGAARSTPIL